MPEYRYGPNSGEYTFHDEVVAFIRQRPAMSEGEAVRFMEDWTLVRGKPIGGELVVHELSVDETPYYLSSYIEGLFEDLGADDDTDCTKP